MDSGHARGNHDQACGYHSSAILGVSHVLSEDGLLLTSSYDGPDGNIVASVGWCDPEVARRNYANAMRAFESRLPQLRERLEEETSTSTSRLTKHRWVNVIVTKGPPTWWLPRIRLSRSEVRFGWLRRAVQIRRRHER